MSDEQSQAYEDTGAGTASSTGDAAVIGAAALPQQSTPEPQRDEDITTISGQVIRSPGPSLITRLGDHFATALRNLGYRSLFYSLRLRGSFPLKLTISPNDPWQGSPDKGAQIVGGIYQTGDRQIKSALPPFQKEDADLGFQADLHSFCWLRDLATLDDKKAAIALGESATRLWLEKYSTFDALAWRPDILAKRLIFWSSYAPIILATDDLIYRSKVLNSIARQSRHLHRSAAKAGDGLPRIWASTALIYMGLILPGAQTRQIKGETLLTRELKHFVYADGGVATRSPAHALETAQILIGLRNLYQDLNKETPSDIQTTIDKLTPALKGLIHADDHLAAFHGPRMASAEQIKDVLAQSGCDAKPTLNGAHSGYQRLSCKKSVVIIDAGPPPATSASALAHASALAFEFSHKGQRIFVNCGGACTGRTQKHDLNFMTRTTAAHNTLVLGNRNSAQIRRDGYIGRSPEQVRYTRREGSAGQWLDLDHDGYKRRFGLLHKRRLFLSEDGLDLRGEDSLILAQDRPKPGSLSDRQLDIRFHLHPDVEATPTQDGEAAILRLPDRSGWMFRARGGKLSIDESIYLDGGKTHKRAKQLVIHTTIDDIPMAANWSCRAMKN